LQKFVQVKLYLFRRNAKTKDTKQISWIAFESLMITCPWVNVIISFLESSLFPRKEGMSYPWYICMDSHVKMHAHRRGFRSEPINLTVNSDHCLHRFMRLYVTHSNTETTDTTLWRQGC
jgi:hypothetical protein